MLTRRDLRHFRIASAILVAMTFALPVSAIWDLEISLGAGVGVVSARRSVTFAAEPVEFVLLSVFFLIVPMLFVLLRRHLVKWLAGRVED